MSTPNGGCSAATAFRIWKDFVRLVSRATWKDRITTPTARPRLADRMRTGLDFQYIQTAILDVSALGGTFTFTNGIWTGNSWGDFLLGLPAAYTQTSYAVIYNRKQLLSGFVQDDYRIARNLTLNL